MERILFFLAALLLSVPDDGHAEVLGRLFYTPAERVRFDQMRQKGIEEAPQSTEPNASEEITAELDKVTLDGFVKRSNGKNTAWLNQLPHHGNDNPQGILVLKKMARSPAISVQLPSGKQVTLKAGQTFDVTNGTIREAYDNSPEKDTLPASQP